MAKMCPQLHKHVKHDNFENFHQITQNLNLGSGDSFCSNFIIFEKNNSNCSTLGATNAKSHEDMPHFAPLKIF